MATLTHVARIATGPARRVQRAARWNPINQLANDRFLDSDQRIMKIIIRIGPQPIAALHIHVRNVELEPQRGIFAESIRETTKLLCAFLRRLITLHPVSDDCNSRYTQRVEHRPYFRQRRFLTAIRSGLQHRAPRSQTFHSLTWPRAFLTGWSAGRVHSPSLSIFSAQLNRALRFSN